MRIDAHIHLDAENKFEERMLAEADHYRIEKLCLSALGKRWPSTPSHEQCVEANRCTAEIVRRYPDRIVGFCYVTPVPPPNPTARGSCGTGPIPPDPYHMRKVLDEIAQCVEGMGFMGIKLWVACRCDEPCVYPIIEKAAALRLPILQHTWYKRGGRENGPGESTCDHIAALAKRYPQAKLIAGHVGGDWERGIKVVKPFPNIIADVCGSDNYAGFVEMAVRELGADRVIFGTDMPGRSMASQIGKVLGADIPETDKEKILGLNMESLLSTAETQSTPRKMSE